ncbi:WD40 repeat protein [Algoriphagus boseongensis]|uniref:WD40 repeat protein n=1 Tax=Algoriphagus boseongensis TaxID=1442587 RepID=A0A4R6TDB7_9BACT|nr:TolB family protein [Algoriphagus boseongensis]TDQ19444.1 WD40 repeat protein [Algoriphagus boseongensis]
MKPQKTSSSPLKFLNVFFGTFLVLSSFINSFGQSSSDSVAIIHLLEREALTWRMGDIQAHADCWEERPYGKILVSTATGQFFDAPVSLMKNPPPSMIGSGGMAFLSNFKMSIQGNSAWVSHDEVSVSKEGKQNFSTEIRMLEKVGNDWKLVGQSNHQFMPPAEKKDTTSYIQTADIYTGRIETVYSANKHIEAPNWHPDNYLIVNSKGRIYTLDLATKEMKVLDTGFATACNNDHGISPDNKWLAISHNDRNDPSPKPYKSVIYILPITGGEPRRITPEVVSYWHGWSPDGKTLAYTGERNGNFDIYTISVNGGKEKRLTDSEGLDDGPDYSPDGKYIYLNSFRTGHMQLWRIDADGKNPAQLTFDDYSNWFPHPSPDGKWIAYISYLEDQAQGHPFGKQVKLRLMNLETKEIKDLTPVFFGGQGTFNVPSWSPDSKKVAFVSYAIQ